MGRFPLGERVCAALVSCLGGGEVRRGRAGHYKLWDGCKGCTGVLWEEADEIGGRGAIRIAGGKVDDEGLASGHRRAEREKMHGRGHDGSDGNAEKWEEMHLMVDLHKQMKDRGSGQSGAVS